MTSKPRGTPLGGSTPQVDRVVGIVCGVGGGAPPQAHQMKMQDFWKKNRINALDHPPTIRDTIPTHLEAKRYYLPEWTLGLEA